MTHSPILSRKDGLRMSPKWTIRRFDSDDDYARWASGDVSPDCEPYETTIIRGNLLLNEGITELGKLMAVGGAATAWDNTNANLGVGNSTTAAAATDTGLIGASKLYKGMEATFPSQVAQTITWRAQFTSGEANFAWAEFSLSNTTLDTGDNLNRLVSAQGTKTSGQTWTLDLDITFS